MKFVLSSMFLMTTLLVLADCQGRGRERLACTSDNFECKCKQLMRPKEKPQVGKEVVVKALADCAKALGIEVPLRGGGKHSTKNVIDMLSDEMKNCLGMEFMKQAGLMSDAGDINADAVVSYLTDAMKVNRDEIAGITSDQIKKIIDAIPECVGKASNDPLKVLALGRCLEQTCIAALST